MKGAVLLKVLVISHNVFSSTDAMGKTLSQLFTGVSPDEIAQFYIHQGKSERNDMISEGS